MQSSWRVSTFSVECNAPDRSPASLVAVHIAPTHLICVQAVGREVVRAKCLWAAGSEIFIAAADGPDWRRMPERIPARPGCDVLDRVDPEPDALIPGEPLTAQPGS